MIRTWSSITLNIPVVITSNRSTHKSNCSSNTRNVIFIRPTKKLLLPCLTPTVAISVKMGLLNVRALQGKSIICLDFIEFHNLDFFFITESWLGVEDNIPLIATAPPNFSYFTLPRPARKVGGLAVIYNNSFKSGMSKSFWGGGRIGWNVTSWGPERRNHAIADCKRARACLRTQLSLTFAFLPVVPVSAKSYTTVSQKLYLLLRIVILAITLMIVCLGRPIILVA